MSGETASPRYIADIMDKINQSPTLEPICLNNMTRIEQDNGGHALRFDLQTGFITQGKRANTPAAPVAGAKPQGGA